MKKLRLFTNAQKEEKWLNNMLQKGWLCKKVNAFNIYTFEKTNDVDQVIRLDCQTFNSEEKFQQYKQFHEEFGWEHVSGSRWSALQYWCKSNNGHDELFSDNESEKFYLQRLIKYYGTGTFLFIILTMSVFKNTVQFMNLKSAYFTPGLWDKEGIDFFSAFLLETPLALLRFSSPWFVLIFGIVFLTTYLKYKKELNKIT